MKKPLVAACVIVVICSLLTVSILLTQFPSSNQNTPEATATPPNTPQQTPKNTAQPTPTTDVAPSPSPTDGQPSESAIQLAIDRAIGNLKATQQPHALLMLNVMYRQFGIAEFNDSLQRYDQILATSSDPYLRVFRRMASYTNNVSASDFAAVSDDIDRLTYPALYADCMALPTNYAATLESARESGGYMMTHALLAAIWLRDNHSTLQLSNTYLSSLYHDVAALTDDGLPVTDINLEAAAFLCLAGQSNLVEANFLQNVLATQNYDGGWCASSDLQGASYWHSSVLALIYLLYMQYPAVSYPPMLPQA